MSDSKTMANQDVIRECGRLRANSDALLVVVIRPNDVSFSVDPKLSPRDFGETLSNEIGKMVQVEAATRMKDKVRIDQ